MLAICYLDEYVQDGLCSEAEGMTVTRRDRQGGCKSFRGEVRDVGTGLGCGTNGVGHLA